MARTVLITGGTGKLGRQLVAHCLRSGDTVITTGRSRESIEALSKTHPEAGTRLHGLVADFSDEAEVERLMLELSRRRLKPTGLVNSARSLDFLKIEANGLVSRQNMIGEFIVDVVAPYELTMALAMQEDTSLRYVVNIGSQYGQVAANPTLYADPSQQSALQYSVAKAALAHLTRELAVRLARQSIQVNCVAFGGVEGRTDDSFRARYANLCPIGRMLTEDEIAGPVEFLLSPACSGMTGQVIAVDGGWTVW